VVVYWSINEPKRRKEGGLPCWAQVRHQKLGCAIGYAFKSTINKDWWQKEGLKSTLIFLINFIFQSGFRVMGKLNRCRYFSLTSSLHHTQHLKAEWYI
jgi:hypothetical protein